MASYSVKCPHCQRELTVQSEWANMQTTCPICQKDFIIPPPPAATVPQATVANSNPPYQRSNPPYQRSNPPYQRSNPPCQQPGTPVPPQRPATQYQKPQTQTESQSGGFKKGSVSALLVLLFLGGFLFYDYYLEPALTFNKLKNKCETVQIPKILKEFYGNVSDIQVSLNKGDRKDIYKGKVEYTRNGRRFSRPIKVTCSISGNKVNYNFALDFQYQNNGKYLEEDADYFFDKLKQDNEELKKYSIHSVDRVETNQVIKQSPLPYYGSIAYCTIRNNRNGKVAIAVSVFEKNQSVQYSFDITEKNIEKNVNALKILAVGGDAVAQFNLGVCYSNGLGVAQNYAEAVKWYRKAAVQGQAQAQNNLGVCYKNGQGVAQNYAEAVKWYRKSAEQGYAGAQFNLGLCYHNGQGVAQNYAEAVKWYRKAAEQGHAIAQNNLGLCYENGQGVAKNQLQAMKWYTQAAEQGDADAQCNLGICYYNSENYAEAVKWFRKAAEQGEARGEYLLGILYAEGKGVPANENAAIQWLTKAAKKGFKAAQDTLKEAGVKY